MPVAGLLATSPAGLDPTWAGTGGRAVAASLVLAGSLITGAGWVLVGATSLVGVTSLVLVGATSLVGVTSLVDGAGSLVLGDDPIGGGRGDLAGGRSHSGGCPEGSGCGSGGPRQRGDGSHGCQQRQRTGGEAAAGAAGAGLVGGAGRTRHVTGIGISDEYLRNRRREAHG